MKRTIILLSLFCLFTFVGSSSAQQARGRVTFSEAINSLNQKVVSINYSGIARGNLQLMELTSVAIDPAACFATTDFSAAHVLGSDRASWVYDASTAKYKVKWILPTNDAVPCRVLLAVDGGVDATDLAVFRQNFGSTGGRQIGSTKTDVTGSRLLPSTPVYKFVIDPRVDGFY